MTIGGSDEQIMIQLIEGYRRRLVVRAGKDIQDFHERERVVHEINRACDKLLADVDSGVLVLAIPDSPWSEGGE